MAALIDELNIPEQDYKEMKKKIANLVYIKQNRLFTKANFDRVFNEWKEMANRLRHGREMLEEKGDGKAPVDKLYDLYVLLLEAMGVYELFFREVLGEDDRYHRALSEITETMKP